LRSGESISVQERQRDADGGADRRYEQAVTDRSGERGRGDKGHEIVMPDEATVPGLECFGQQRPNRENREQKEQQREPDERRAHHDIVAAEQLA
jgi:hypothetical protein